MEDEIRNPHGERLDYTYHPGGDDAAQTVVIGHGVTGNKDRAHLVALANGLAAAGFNALRFSFAGNGESQGDFGQCTITKEVGDLTAVLDALDGSGQMLVYAGHSMGGAVGVLTAAQDPRIAGLVSLAGMVDCKQFAETEFGDEESGLMWGEEGCPLTEHYMDDMRSLGSIADRGAEVRVPWLLIHGTEDDVVPIQDSHDIYDKANEPKQLHIIGGADHSFNDPAHCKEMVQTVVTWARTL